jgi:hypothetical protein
MRKEKLKGDDCMSDKSIVAIKKFVLTIKIPNPATGGRKGWYPGITGKKLEKKKIELTLLKEQIAQFLELSPQNIEIMEINNEEQGQ